MAKGDKYYLINNETKHIVAKFVLTDDYMTGDCYVSYSWNADGTPSDYYYFAELYCKWDSCTHWWFRGEDYDKEMDKDFDSYYHICGNHIFQDHIRTMCFAWKVAHIELLKEHNDRPHMKSDINRFYLGDEKLKALIDIMLDGYTIKKTEKENEYVTC